MQRVGPASYSLEPGTRNAEQLGDAQPPVANPYAEQPKPGVPPAQLPRLLPPTSDEQRAPEVTVNIGRIEVVPAARPEPPPVRERRRARAAASGAPELADYLRDRSRR